MNIVLHPTYFPNIAHFVAMVHADEVTYEIEDNFQKQTYRNRAYIYAANGKLLLNIPVLHTQKNRQKYCDVKIANQEKWQDIHWKSLQSAYSTSPFFEFYEDEFIVLFSEPADNLLDFNFKCIDVVLDCLQLELKISRTTTFEKNILNKIDYRSLVKAKKERTFNFDPYTQVFSDKYGFISNLSILDLLFNEGPNALNYLQSQHLNFQ